MASDNLVTLVGNITGDPELRFTPSGAPVANFTVAVNRRFRTPEGQWEDKLDGFFRCNCWRDMAENVADSLEKGARVVVVGRLQQRSWDDQDGNKRSTVEVQVDEVGPSLRWASAKVQKSQRTSSSSPSGEAAPAQGSGGQGSGGQGSGGQPSRGDWGPPSAVGAPTDEAGF